MTTEEKFRAAVNVIKNLPKNGSYQPSHELMLRFYAYFKQATEGPCRAPRPAFWEVVKKMKWDAWHRLGDMPRHQAMDAYVDELKKIVETMSYTDNVASFLGSLGSFYDQVPMEDLELLVGPVIERMRSQPGSPLSGSPFGSREASPTRAPGTVVNGSGGGGRLVSSLETSPASSYSASPQPPEEEDDEDEEDEEDEDEFKDTLEWGDEGETSDSSGQDSASAPERFSKEAPVSGVQSPMPKKATHTNGPLTNGLGPMALNGHAVNGINGVNGHKGHLSEEDETAAVVREAAERVARPKTRGSPPTRVRGLPTQHTGSGSGALDISEPVAAAVARLQQDLQQVMGRLGSLEKAVLARDSRAQKQPSLTGASSSAVVPRRYPRWWPIRDLSPRTFLLLTAWPVLIHLLMAWVQRRRRMRLA